MFGKPAQVWAGHFLEESSHTHRGKELYYNKF